MGILIISAAVSFLLLTKIKHGIFNWILCGVLLWSSFLLFGALFGGTPLGGILTLLFSCALLFVALFIGGDKPDAPQKDKFDENDKIYLVEENCRKNPQAAMQSLTKMADAGSAEAYYMLGELYYYGIGISSDKVVAASQYLKAHQLGCVDATYSLGYMHLNGDGIPEDVSKGIDFLKRAASHDYAKAYRQLGFLYFRGIKVPEDFSASFKYMLHGAELDDGAAQAHVAQAYEVEKWGAPRRDTVAAKQYFDKALKNNNDHAFWCIGQRHLLGINGYQKDEQKAFSHFKSSAELDYDKGCLSLALCYLRGTGTEKNLAAALPWLKKASEKGNQDATWRYGVLLVSGVAGLSPTTYDEGCALIQDYVILNPDNENAKAIAAKLAALKQQHNSGTKHSDATADLLSYATVQTHLEKNDADLYSLEQAQDGCNRVIIAKAHLEAYGCLAAGVWDDCFDEASKALQAFKEMNWPNEKDNASLRETYGYLAVSSYKMSVEFGVHTFSEAEEFFKKAKPFQNELGKQFSFYYEEFRSGHLRPAQERGVIGKIDMLFFQKNYDAAYDLFDQITDPDVFKLNLHTRAILGAHMLGRTPFAEEILESVVRDDTYKIKAKSVYVVQVALRHHYNNYKNTLDPQDKTYVYKWIDILKIAGGNVFPVVVDLLGKSEQDYGELLQWIQE